MMQCSKLYYVDSYNSGDDSETSVLRNEESDASEGLLSGGSLVLGALGTVVRHGADGQTGPLRRVPHHDDGRPVQRSGPSHGVRRHVGRRPPQAFGLRRQAARILLSPVHRYITNF